LLEKAYLATGKKIFYSFSGNLQVTTDLSSRKKYSIQRVKADRYKNEWVLVNSRYLVKLDNDIRQFEYLSHDPELLPLGKLNSFYIETGAVKSRSQNENMMWLSGDNGVSGIKKRNHLVKQIPVDSLSVSGYKIG
jgi:hypothetical protein